MIVDVRTVEELRNRMNRCAAAIGRNEASNSLQSCFLLEATTDGISGRLSLTAVDSRSHQLTLSLGEGSVDVLEPGAVLVPHDFITQLLNRLSGQSAMTLEADTSGRLIVKCNPHRFPVFLHQGNVDDYRLCTTTEDQLPPEVCRIPGSQLNRLIGDSLTVINDQEDFKLVGEGITLHAYAHDRGGNIVSHVSVEAREQSQDWCVSLAARLIKLINKCWADDDISIHLEETRNGPVLAFSNGHDFFVVRQLSTQFDVQALDDALGQERIGSFLVDGSDMRTMGKLLDLAKGAINVEIRNNLLNFVYAHAARSDDNQVKIPTREIEGSLPPSKFSKDLLRKAIASMDVDNLRGELVPAPNNSGNHLLRFIDEDLPQHRQVLIVPTDG